MTSVKVECDCGQRYAFDVEPVHGRMPAPVACPACGADGTAKANTVLAQTAVAASPVRVSLGAVRMATAIPVAAAVPAHVALAAPVAIAAPALPPPVPPSLPPPRAVSAPPPATAMPRPPMVPGRPPAAKPARGKDGWNAPETGLNKLGSYIASGPAIIAALIAWGIFGFQLDIVMLAGVVGVFGIMGGILNVLGRGPIWAGACVGLVTALGGFGATCWWIHGRKSAYKLELILAFALGCAPGIGLQYLLQRLVRRRTG